MSGALALGVNVGATYTGWVVRRGTELLAGGTWLNPASVEVDARRQPVPPPVAAALAQLLQTIREGLDGLCPTSVRVSEVVMPVPTSQRGTVSKRALHSLPAVAAIWGAVVGAWPDVAVSIPAPDAVNVATLPKKLQTPARKGHSGGISRVSGGYRGGLGEVRGAWMLAGDVTAHAAAGGVPADLESPPAAAAAATAPPSPLERYVGALVAHIATLAAKTELEFIGACDAALSGVPRPPGVPALSVEVLAEYARGQGVGPTA